MSSASGNVGTQTHVRGAEVVDRVKGSQLALDVLASRPIEIHTVVDAMRQVQRHVVGQEVTDTGTVERTFVKTGSSIRLVVLGERVHFYRALALGHRTDGRSGNQRTNDYAQGVFQFHPLNPQQGNL
ncbi:hypothetical protein D3C84_767600 [compost metagenome]